MTSAAFPRLVTLAWLAVFAVWAISALVQAQKVAFENFAIPLELIAYIGVIVLGVSMLAFAQWHNQTVDKSAHRKNLDD
jgi:ABC-type nickel/cobalt efflux system permease component RcnA